MQAALRTLILLMVIPTLLLYAPLALGQQEVVIAIPALAIESAMIEFALGDDGWIINPWAREIGHLEGTSHFGAPGNTVLAGHSQFPSKRPGIFADLHLLEAGDSVLITVNGLERHYTIVEVSTVSMYDMRVIIPQGDERLTLLTCEAASFDPHSRLYQRRVIAIAHPTE